MPRKKLLKTILPEYKVTPEYSIEPQDYGKDLDINLPSKDRKALELAFAQMRREIYQTEEPFSNTASYFMSIDGTINFTEDQIIDAKVEVKNERTMYGVVKSECIVEVTLTTEEGVPMAMILNNLMEGRHQAVIRFFKNGLLFRSLNLQDVILTEVSVDESNEKFTLIFMPSYWTLS